MSYHVIKEALRVLRGLWSVTLAVFLASSGLLTGSTSAAELSRPVQIGALNASWGPTISTVGLRDGLRELGYRENEDFVIGVRFTQGDLAALPVVAHELVQYGIDLIFAAEAAPAKAAKMATSQIPTVFAEVRDPIGSGLVQSFARPGGNITGVTDLGIELGPKRLELFQKIIPGLKRVLFPYAETDTFAVAAAKGYREAALVARVKSMLRIKALHDTVQEQATHLEAQSKQLEEWNHTLEQRVQDQVAELERMGRLKRFFSPQLAEIVVSSGGDTLLESHRREITVVFCDLRGFTAFSAAVEPEELMAVLKEYHTAMGHLIFHFEGTLERFTGDGMMVFFNDPLPCPDPAVRAVRMAVAMRQQMDKLIEQWRTRGHQLGFGVGIAQGDATLGMIGFEGRIDYAAIGPVTNLASRLCDKAQDGQVLISQQVFAVVKDLLETEPAVELILKGILKPVPAFNVVGLR